MIPDETDLADRIRRIEDRIEKLERKVLGDDDRFVNEELKTYGFR